MQVLFTKNPGVHVYPVALACGAQEVNLLVEADLHRLKKRILAQRQTWDRFVGPNPMKTNFLNNQTQCFPIRQDTTRLELFS